MRARRSSQTTPGLIAAATITPRKTRAITTLIFQRTSAATTIPRTTRVATATRRAVVPIRGFVARLSNAQSRGPGFRRAHFGRRAAARDRARPPARPRAAARDARRDGLRCRLARVRAGGAPARCCGRLRRRSGLAVGPDARDRHDREALRLARDRAAAC